MRIERRENFKGKDSVLIFGDKTDMRKLFELFQSWDGEEVDLIAALSTQEKGGQLSALTLRQVVSGNAITWKANVGSWRLSLDSGKNVAGLLEGLLDSTEAGHQYLDDGIGDVQVIASIGEYR